MKNRLFFIGLLVAFAMPAFAQLDNVRSNKNEFSYGYGILPASSVYLAAGSNFHVESDHIGSVFFTYTCRLTKIIGIGFTICYDPVKMTYYDDVNGQCIPVCKVNENCFTLMPHLKLNWLNTKYVNLYSKVAFSGFHYFTYKQDVYHPELYEVQPPDPMETIMAPFQITPYGIEIGTKRCAGFVQVGYGMEGVLCIGFRYGIKD